MADFRPDTESGLPILVAQDYTHGPAHFSVPGAGLNQLLIPTPGSTKHIYVTSITTSVGALSGSLATTLVQFIALGEWVVRCGGHIAKLGGQLTFAFSPPWTLPAATDLGVSITGAPASGSPIKITVMYTTSE